MPRGHSFLYGVDTNHTGVILPKYLKDEFPNEIWLILEYEFEYISHGEVGMMMRLRFDGKSETLIIPYESIFRFVDDQADYDISF